MNMQLHPIIIAHKHFISGMFIHGLVQVHGESL